MEFVSSLVGHLVWPLVVVVLVWIFRSSIAGLIGQLSSWEGLGQKVRFGRELARVEEGVAEVAERVEAQADAAAVEGKSPTPEITESDPFIALRKDAESNPSHVILASWELLAGSLKDLFGTVAAHRQLSSVGDRIWQDAVQMTRRLEVAGTVNHDMTNSVEELRRLRNLVAHGRYKPTPGEALAYEETARELSRAAIVLANLEVQQTARSQ
ncbi:hypothetical protein ACFTSF_39285 [Kribbella sp. NPDC056951]|uniref:hypothetical protein n=1 Tax=Kribbella sp. NPDC056951 TaxID=3345978 RepID=UPI00362EA14F